MSLDPVGLEGLGLFEPPELPPFESSAGYMLRMSDAQWRGAALRDAALTKAASGRQEAIQRVRGWLLSERWQVATPATNTITADDVMDAVEALGLSEKDNRWVGNVCRGWEAVTPTVHFVPSRRKDRHHAPLRTWLWR